MVVDSTLPFPDGGAVGLQADGKILLAGIADSLSTSADCILERYNSDGTPDSSFGIGGTAGTHLGIGYNVVTSIAVQGDGKILVAGSSGTYPSSLSSFTIVRYNPDGTLDATFNSGIVLTNFGDIGGAGISGINSIALQPDGKIVAAGFFSPTPMTSTEFALARYNPDGTLDTTFGIEFSLGPFSSGNRETLTHLSLPQPPPRYAS